MLLSSEPYRFTQAHCDALKQDPRVAGKPIELIDGEQVSWYGVRAIDGIRYLSHYAAARRRAFGPACEQAVQRPLLGLIRNFWPVARWE